MRAGPRRPARAAGCGRATSIPTRQPPVPLGALAEGPGRAVRLRSDPATSRTASRTSSTVCASAASPLARRSWRCSTNRCTCSPACSSRSATTDALAAARRADRRSSSSASRRAREAPAADGGVRRARARPALLRALTEYEEHRLRENLRRGRAICPDRRDLRDPLLRGGALRAHRARSARSARCSRRCRRRATSPDAQIRFSLLVASDCAGRRARAAGSTVPQAPSALVRAGAAARRGRRRSPRRRRPAAARGRRRRADEDARRRATRERRGGRARIAASRSATRCASTSASSTS